MYIPPFARRYVRFPVSCLTYVGTARSYYSVHGAAGEEVEGMKAGRLECVSSQRGVAHVKKKIESRAANGCLDALI